MKNKLLKRTFSLFLAILMLFMIPSSAFASSGEEAEIVARVSYLCYVRVPGHCWIYVENLTDETFTVGIYELEPYGGVSVGTFGHTRYDGWGIYYNIEAYVQSAHGIGNCTVLTEELTRDELAKLSNAIYSYKNSWSYFKNCTAFAADVWNTVSDKKMSALVFPAFVRIIMLLRGCKSVSPEMKPVTKNEVYRQIGNGSDAYLKNVKDRSLKALV